MSRNKKLTVECLQYWTECFESWFESKVKIDNFTIKFQIKPKQNEYNIQEVVSYYFKILVYDTLKL